MLTHREALEVVAAHRRDHVVVTTMGSVGLWPAISDTPRDFHYLPSSMGQGVPLGLGLCLAKPGLGVVVLTGRGERDFTRDFSRAFLAARPAVVVASPEA